DGISCNSAIRTSPWPVARLLLLGLRPRALQLDAQSFNAAMAEDESWARALELLSAARVSPSAVSYNTAISSCAQAKASSAALRLLSQMSKFFRLDAFSFSSALNACSWHTALDLVGRMASLLVPCNAVTRLALVAACAGRWREAAGVAAREGPAWSGAVGVTEKCGQEMTGPSPLAHFLCRNFAGIESLDFPSAFRTVEENKAENKISITMSAQGHLEPGKAAETESEEEEEPEEKPKEAEPEEPEEEDPKADDFEEDVPEEGTSNGEDGDVASLLAKCAKAAEEASRYAKTAADFAHQAAEAAETARQGREANESNVALTKSIAHSAIVLTLTVVKAVRVVGYATMDVAAQCRIAARKFTQTDCAESSTEAMGLGLEALNAALACAEVTETTAAELQSKEGTDEGDRFVGAA
ncbi:unnamed protein product, partial [Effrenium voratum]